MECKEVSFKVLKRKMDAIKKMYIGSKIQLAMGKEVEEKFILTLNEDDEIRSIELIPFKFIIGINEALNMLPFLCGKILKVEVFEIEKEEDYWYLKLISRSTYYRYRKQAYMLFLSIFEGVKLWTKYYWF